MNIDPDTSAEAYRHRVIAQLTEGDTAQPSQVREQLSGACTTEIAAFDDFVGLLAGGAASYKHVVFDTAPTGHTLLPMDATGAYHRQMASSLAGSSTHFVTPLMHLQDPGYTRILLVTLPETTPVSEGAALQDDLRHAPIEPFAWVVNRSLAAAGPRDPLLRARLRGEQAQFARVPDGLAQRCYVLPWQAEPPVGFLALAALAPLAGSQRLGAGAQALK